MVGGPGRAKGRTGSSYAATRHTGPAAMSRVSDVAFLRGKRPTDTELRSHPVLNEVTSYWEALRHGLSVPYRSEVDPRGIQSALKHAFVLERMAPGMARIRVAGQVLTDVMGMEMRGMPMSSLIAPDTREMFRRALEDVFSGPATASLRMCAESTGLSRPALSAQMLLLPLRGETGKVSRILGAMVVEGRIGRAPRRFHLEGSFLRQLEGGDLRRRLTPQAPEAAAIRAATKPTPYPHLRVVLTDG